MWDIHSSGFDVYLHEKDQFWPRQGSSDHGDKVLSEIIIRDGSGYQTRWNFWKLPKGGEVIFNPKIYVADFGTFNRALLFEHGIDTKESFQGSAYVFSTIVLRKIKSRHTFKGTSESLPLPPLELFQKFIRFGDAIRPHGTYTTIWCTQFLKALYPF